MARLALSGHKNVSRFFHSGQALTPLLVAGPLKRDRYFFAASLTLQISPVFSLVVVDIIKRYEEIILDILWINIMCVRAQILRYLVCYFTLIYRIIIARSNCIKPSTRNFSVNQG